MHSTKTYIHVQVCMYMCLNVLQPISFPLSLSLSPFAAADAGWALLLAKMSVFSFLVIYLLLKICCVLALLIWLFGAIFSCFSAQRIYLLNSACLLLPLANASHTHTPNRFTIVIRFCSVLFCLFLLSPLHPFHSGNFGKKVNVHNCWN